ncbi:ABC transporter substrate-binding protein [Azorhizobium oxalatiphilum]|uniref:ABC transporter substrate-binding protein n=1 Tax=Azorhizobium oxalatiphilum TaxID=980631 RepID=A0A917C1R0_9HYPH|nr:transporter substrate-binding domain-containing protein [Azorhizobium oxalatiphilum]GGF68036.1 ABC transporter substrate-binding protein [Azorhizobium oxalatiphilum]
MFHRISALVLGLAGCVAGLWLAPASAADSRLETIVKRDKVIVAVSSTARPNGFIDENGKLTGFEVEFARLMAKALVGDPNKIELMTTTVDGRFPAVLSGKADFGISTATIYPDRAVRLAFTRPYIDSSTLVVVPKGSPIKTLADLDSESVVLGSTNSAAMVDRAKLYAPKAKAIFFDTDSAAVLALKSGRSTAWQADSAAANFFVGQSEGAFVVLDGSLGTINNNAIFMKPGDFELWLALDTIVREYVNGSRYGEYAALYKTWFGKEPPPQRPFNQN